MPPLLPPSCCTALSLPLAHIMPFAPPPLLPPSPSPPQLLYSLLLELLAESGYTTIATPYAITFRSGLSHPCTECKR